MEAEQLNSISNKLDDLAQRAAERPFNFADCVHPLPLGFTRLQDGQTVRFGGRDWDVATGDGHAPEHATFWSRDDDLVIGGDQLLPGISPNLGVYPTEPAADPVGEWLDSCTRFAAMAEDRHLVLPGQTDSVLRGVQQPGRHQAGRQLGVL